MTSLPAILAATAPVVVSGDNLINSIIWLVISGLIIGLLFWFVDYVKLVEPFNKVCKVLLALVAILILINFLLGLAGHPIFVR